MSQQQAGRPGSGDTGSQKWDQFGDAYDQPTFSGTPRTYVIASMPRSGSHMLGHLLHGTGQLGSPLEYIHTQHLATWQERLGEPTRAATLQAVMRRRTSPSGWFGVKAHWKQFADVMDDQEVMAVLDPQDWIRITRSDKVAQAVSLVIAQQTKAWISFHQAKGEPVYDADAITKGIRAFQKQESAWDTFFETRGITPHVVVYEEMLEDPARTVADVCARLDVPVPAVLPEPGTTRQATAVNAEWRARYLAESGSR
ncbi:Stf0 family sulfotransferase [Isoptericola sp. b408]|uniref:Stf0 family sulfotransferase n=1 Tax=Isoptericola sp. b408 TaxID=3064653 RepID=UPI002712DEDF|nr:Stf0 family sulfotransferase [Isoptericola sp. b408]MDO8152701.1 Stf0 family sulfotransferase [Isoptericola sp. b408]